MSTPEPAARIAARVVDLLTAGASLRFDVLSAEDHARVDELARRPQSHHVYFNSSASGWTYLAVAVATAVREVFRDGPLTDIVTPALLKDARDALRTIYADLGGEHGEQVPVTEIVAHAQRIAKQLATLATSLDNRGIEPFRGCEVEAIVHALDDAREQRDRARAEATTVREHSDAMARALTEIRLLVEPRSLVHRSDTDIVAAVRRMRDDRFHLRVRAWLDKLGRAADAFVRECRK